MGSEWESVYDWDRKTKLNPGWDRFRVARTYGKERKKMAAG